MIGERGTNLGATKIHSHVRRTPRTSGCFVWAQVCVVAQGKENEALGELRRKQQVERKAAKQTASPRSNAQQHEQTNKRTSERLRCDAVVRRAVLYGVPRCCAAHSVHAHRTVRRCRR
jgi:hypothetical protein